MKHLFTPAAAALLLSFSANAGAQATDQATLTTKVSAYSEYEYRGISQTSEKPAAQLNIDWSHPSGFYAGAFVSNISWLKDTAKANNFSTNAKAEIDLFAGFKTEIAKDVTMDIGALRYQYPSSKAFAPSPNTTEVYVGASAGAFNMKYSQSVTTLFGFAGSKRSTFTEANWSGEIAKGLTANAHLARQTVRANGAFSYNVFKLGLTWDMGQGWNLGGYFKGTDADDKFYTVLGREWSAERLVVFVSKTF
jgi:uncharacterized protein (TIGR02001 family)